MDFSSKYAMKYGLLVLLCFLVVDVAGQAKLPTLMIVPSELYCRENNFTTTYKDENGQDNVVPDYKKALVSSRDLQAAINSLSSVMEDRGFPLRNLEETLNGLQQSSAERSLRKTKVVESPLDQLWQTARADIILNLDFSIQQQGPRKYVTFNLQARDAYSKKDVASVGGDGNPSMSATVGTMIQEAVLNYMDGFNVKLKRHFEDMLLKGREVALTIQVADGSGIHLSSDIPYVNSSGETKIVPLSRVLKSVWLKKSCVEGRFTELNSSDTELKLVQVRMPLAMVDDLEGEMVSIGISDFVANLKSWLRQYKIYSTSDSKGLGEATLIISDQDMN